MQYYLPNHSALQAPYYTYWACVKREMRTHRVRQLPAGSNILVAYNHVVDLRKILTALDILKPTLYGFKFVGVDCSFPYYIYFQLFSTAISSSVYHDHVMGSPTVFLSRAGSQFNLECLV